MFAFASMSPSKLNIVSMEMQKQTHGMGLNPFCTVDGDIDTNANVKCEHSIINKHSYLQVDPASAEQETAEIVNAQKSVPKEDLATVLWLVVSSNALPLTESPYLNCRYFVSAKRK